jgi:hypothetical protein
MTKVSARPEKIPHVRLIPTPMDLLKVRATAYATADPSTIPERETTSLVARSPPIKASKSRAKNVRRPKTTTPPPLARPWPAEHG